MFASKLITLIALSGLLSVAMAEELSVLNETEQKCLIMATPWLTNIQRTEELDNFYTHVMELINAQATSIGQPSAETTYDCSIYNSIVDLILNNTNCDDGSKALEAFNKLMASPHDDDGFMTKYTGFTDVFNHVTVCHAHLGSATA